MSQQADKAKLRPIHRVRLANLTALIDSRFKGNATHCANELGRSHTYIWQLINKYRSIGEATARRIEAALKLDVLSLDQPKGVTAATAAVVAHLGDGTSRVMPMARRVALDDLHRMVGTVKHGSECRPCTHPGVSDRVVYFEVEEALTSAILIGDHAFVDPAQVEIERGAIYVVRPKGKDQSVVRRAVLRDGTLMLEPVVQSKLPSYRVRDVRVCGRVVQVTRERVVA